MKKRIVFLLSLMIFLSGYVSLNAADIKGKVTLSPKGEPYAHGNILLMPLGEELFTKAEIDAEGNYQYSDLTPGRYLLKMDLYSLTPFETEVTITGESEMKVIDIDLTLTFLDKVLVFTKEASDFIWFPLMVVFLLTIGVVLTIFTRLIQVRRLLLSLKMVLRGALHKDKAEKEEGDITPYAALMTALAATHCRERKSGRCGHSHRHRWPGSSCLDVDSRILRDGHKIRRRLSWSQVPDKKRTRRNVRRADVLRQTWHQK